VRGIDQEVDRPFVLGLIQDLDRGASDVLILVADQLEAASITRGPPILASASAARLRTHQSSSLID
jgi:hypothetical protein